MTNTEKKQISVLFGAIAAISLSVIMNEKAKVLIMRREAERNRVLVKETHRILKNFYDGKYKEMSDVREDLKFSNIIFQEYLNGKFV